jgi:hypothetical protein
MIPSKRKLNCDCQNSGVCTDLNRVDLKVLLALLAPKCKAGLLTSEASDYVDDTYSDNSHLFCLKDVSAFFRS